MPLRMTCRMTKPMTNARTAFPQHAALGHQMFVFEPGLLVLELLEFQSVRFAIFALVQIVGEPLGEVCLPKSAQNLAPELRLASAHDLFSSEPFCSRRKIKSVVSRTIVQRMDAYQFPETAKPVPVQLKKFAVDRGYQRILRCYDVEQDEVVTANTASQRRPHRALVCVTRGILPSHSFDNNRGRHAAGGAHGDEAALEPVAPIG